MGILSCSRNRSSITVCRVPVPAEGVIVRIARNGPLSNECSDWAKYGQSIPSMVYCQVVVEVEGCNSRNARLQSTAQWASACNNNAPHHAKRWSSVSASLGVLATNEQTPLWLKEGTWTLGDLPSHLWEQTFAQCHAAFLRGQRS